MVGGGACTNSTTARTFGARVRAITVLASGSSDCFSVGTPHAHSTTVMSVAQRQTKKLTSDAHCGTSLSTQEEFIAVIVDMLPRNSSMLGRLV